MFLVAVASAFQVEIVKPFSDNDTSAEFKFQSNFSSTYKSEVFISPLGIGEANVSMDGQPCTLWAWNNSHATYNCSSNAGVGWNYPKINIVFGDIVEGSRSIDVQFELLDPPLVVPSLPNITQHVKNTTPVPWPPVQNTTPPAPKPKPKPTPTPTPTPPAQYTTQNISQNTTQNTSWFSWPSWLVYTINTSGPVNSTGAPLFIALPDELPSYTPLVVILGLSCLIVGGVIFYIKSGDKGVEMEDPL